MLLEKKLKQYDVPKKRKYTNVNCYYIKKTKNKTKKDFV